MYLDPICVAIVARKASAPVRYRFLYLGRIRRTPEHGAECHDLRWGDINCLCAAEPLELRRLEPGEVLVLRDRG